VKAKAATAKESNLMRKAHLKMAEGLVLGAPPQHHRSAAEREGHRIN
jgi:hypothetical protein